MTREMMMEQFKVGDMVTLECAKSVYTGRIFSFTAEEIAMKEVTRKKGCRDAIEQDKDCGFSIPIASIRRSILEI